MANINAPQIEYYESFANEIESKFRRLQKIIGHPTATGNYHEEILRTVLRNFLSKRFSVKTGFIYDGPNKASKQIDLMVIDENTPSAYIFQEEDFAVVLPKAVVAVMEIKTTIDVKGFDKALENIASAKSLMEFPVNLAGIIFGFDGTKPSDKTLDKWFRNSIPSSYKEREDIAPDAIMFFSASSLLVRCDESGRIGSDGKYYHRIGIDDEGELHGAPFQISIILAMIINACMKKDFANTHIFPESNAFVSLVQAERGGLSNERFRFGEGKVANS